MIQFNCQHCGKKVKVSDSAAGKKGKCAACGNMIQIPDLPTKPTWTCLGCDRQLQVAEGQTDFSLCENCRKNESLETDEEFPIHETHQHFGRQHKKASVNSGLQMKHAGQLASVIIGGCILLYIYAPPESRVVPILIVVTLFLCVTAMLAIHVNQSAAAAKKRLEAAKIAYRLSLSYLRDDPNNAELRQETLEFGREYSSLTRNQKRVTIFDEVALKNDIDAACAGAVKVAHPDQSSVKSRLENLDELLKSNMITKAEYEERRKGILDSV
jgi:hypothetical protein